MKPSRLLLCAPFLLAPLAFPTRQDREDESMHARIDLVVEEALGTSGSATLVLYAESKGEVLLEKSYGPAPLARAGASLFRVGALGETFVAVALLQLAAEGALDLDADVASILPGLAFEGAKVPVRTLLTHTSGLASDERFFRALGAWRATAKAREASSKPASDLPEPIAEIVLVLGQLGLDSSPESCFDFQHTNHVVACAVLERVTQKPLAEVLRARIFEPLGMRSTRFREDGPPLVRATSQSQALGNQNLDIPTHAELFGEDLLCSSAADLARFMKGLSERELVDAKSFRALSQSARLADGSETGYSMGFTLSRLDDQPALSAGGALSGSRVQLAHYPALDTTLVVLSDRDALPTQRIERRVARALFDIPEPGIQDWPLTPRELARYTGVYQLGCTRMEVRIQAEHLTLGWEDHPSARLLHQGRHLFVLGLDPELRLQFTLDADKATSFDLDDHGKLATAVRFGD